MATVPVLPDERWQRLAHTFDAVLARWPAATRAIRVAAASSTLVVVLACFFQRQFREGVRVWVACALMLVAWTAIAATRTLRWTSVARLFSLAMVWALVVAWLSARWSHVRFLSPLNDGPRVAIAGLVEETFKLLPLAALAVAGPGRLRRMAIADWLLCGLAFGMGFQAAEDAVRQIVYRPGIFDLLSGGRHWSYGWTLFGGSFNLHNQAAFAGHHITTALVSAGIGLAVHAVTRRRCYWPLACATPAILWVIVVCDHMAYNAASADANYVTAHASRVPQLVHNIWAITGHGFHRGWLLLLLTGIVLLVDAGALTEPALADGAPRSDSTSSTERENTRRRHAPGGNASGGAVRSAAATTGRSVARWTARRGRRLLDDARTRARAALAAGAASSAAGPRSRFAAVVVALDGLRAAREAAMSTDNLRGRRVTRRSAAVAGATAAVGAQQAATALARRIGTSVQARNTRWFAGLLDAIRAWWDGLGPGGQALVVAGGLALLIGGALILMPEIVVGVGGLEVVGGTLGGAVVTIPATVTTSAGEVVAGLGLAMTASGSASGGNTSGGEGGPPEGGGTTHDPSRLEELAKDPAHGGAATAKGIEEARVGLDLEARGDLAGPITRDPSGAAEFIDANDQAWDVKGWHSGYANGYDLDTALRQIGTSIAKNENVIVDTAKMSSTAVSELRTAVEGVAEWAGRVLWR